MSGREFNASGIGWAGSVPTDWRVARLVSVARLESGHTPSRQHLEYWIPSECTIPWFSLADVWQLRDESRRYVSETREMISPKGIANSAARLLPVGTVILSRTASVGYSGILAKPMATTQDFANFVCGRHLLPEYLLYSLRAMRSDFERLMMGSTHRTIYMPDIRRLATPLPGLGEQRAIADFLDEKTAAIDALIAKKERLLALLDEKRQALITQAVTKGLNPSAPMKDSGVEWLGPVPAHWRVERIKWVAKLESGHTPDKKVAEYWENCTIPWVSLNDTKALMSSDYIDDTAYHVNDLGLANSSAHLLPARVVAFTRDATIGAAAITTRPMAVSQHIIAWVCGPRILPEFLLRVFYAMRDELDRLTFGATIKTIGMDDVLTLTTPIPPVEEQRRIVAVVEERQRKCNDAASAVRKQLDVLREYRQAVITAAVTGQLEVRSKQARAMEPAA